jgi:glycosyltransferase involved in cell wall biosynthesis
VVILHLITGLYHGGAERQLQQLILHSDKGRFRHVVISLLEGGAVAAELAAAGIEVRSLGMARGLPGPTGFFRLLRLLRWYKPDILHCWLYHACLLGAVAAPLGKVPKMIWGLRSANPQLRDYPLSTRAAARLCAALSFLPDAIIVNSETSRSVHEQWGYKTRAMRVFANSVDATRFFPNVEARKSVRAELGLSPHNLLVGLFARYSPMKDHDTFFRAAKLLYKQHPQVRFLLAGERIDGDNLQLVRMLEENCLEEVTYLLGPRSDVPRLTAALDVCCLSSWSESFPNVIVEAMACAIPCVATDVGDVARIIGDAGRVVSPSAPEALAEAMGALVVLDPVERTALGQAGRRRALASYTVQQNVSQYEDLYLSYGNKV